MGAKAELSAADVSAFAPLMHTLTHAEFSEPLLVTIKRMFLRMPDRLLSVLRHLFPAITLDLGRYFPTLVRVPNSNSINVTDRAAPQLHLMVMCGV